MEWEGWGLHGGVERGGQGIDLEGVEGENKDVGETKGRHTRPDRSVEASASVSLFSLLPSPSLPYPRH